MVKIIGTKAHYDYDKLPLIFFSERTMRTVPTQTCQACAISFFKRTCSILTFLLATASSVSFAGGRTVTPALRAKQKGNYFFKCTICLEE